MACRRTRLAPQQVTATGPDGAVYEPFFFEEHVGEVAAFVPVASSSEVLAAGSFAVAVHHAPDALTKLFTAGPWLTAAIRPG